MTRVNIATEASVTALSVQGTGGFTMVIGGAGGAAYDFAQNAGIRSSGGHMSLVVTSPPGLFAAGTLVSSVFFDVGPVDTTSDSYDLAAFLVVTDPAGTNVLQVTAAGNIPTVGPNQSGQVDFGSATPTVLVGSDLSWDGSVDSAAGGVYVVSLICTGGWD